MNNKIEIQVITKPVNISFECPFCKEKIEIDYTDFDYADFDYADFAEMVYDPSDYNNKNIDCPKCGKELGIDGPGLALK